MKSLPNKLTSSLCGYLEAYLCLWMGAEVFIKDGYVLMKWTSVSAYTGRNYVGYEK